jgi:hypothetical protein
VDDTENENTSYVLHHNAFGTWNVKGDPIKLILTEYHMEFSTKIAIVVADDLQMWQKLNVVAFLTSGIISQTEETLSGEAYEDASGQVYSSLCVQPVVILKAGRERLPTFLNRANNRELTASIYIQDMFETGHDAANRETVTKYETEALPLVGIGLRADRKVVDKIFKGAKLHD